MPKQRVPSWLWLELRHEDELRGKAPPAWCGVAFRPMNRAVTYYCPMPLNLVIGFVLKAYWRVRCGLKPDIVVGAYSRGRADGRKQGAEYARREYARGKREGGRKLSEVRGLLKQIEGLRGRKERAFDANRVKRG